MSDQMQPFKESATLTRRNFTLEAVLALLAGCVITISDACGSDSSPNNPTPVDINGVISANHSHVAVVTGAQITAGTAVVLNIQGTAAHNHTVSLSQADLQTLKNRQAVSRDSSNDPSVLFGPHLHSVTFMPV